MRQHHNPHDTLSTIRTVCRGTAVGLTFAVTFVVLSALRTDG
jgi:hypothetical protein